MARTVRIQYAGAVYHVMSRGNRREAIFLDDRDRGVFLATLAEMCGRTGARVHSYVLLTNHYHLLLETPEPNLVAGMKWMQGTYTQRFHARHRQGGHLFQGRYKAIPVEAEEPGYFATVSEYLHLNPIRAGMLDATQTLINYRWSSYPAFVQSGEMPAWLRRERVFAALELPDTEGRARERYAGWMEARIRAVREQEPTGEEAAAWRQLRRGWYLGGDRFRDQLMDWAKGAVAGKQRDSFAPEGLRNHDEAEAERWLQEELQRSGLSLEQAAELRHSDRRKQSLAWLLKSRTVVGDEWILQRLRMGHRSNISRAVKAFRHEPTSPAAY